VASYGFILTVCDLDLATLEERQLDLPIRIGRSTLNDLSVPHRLVSEFHARIELVDGRLCVLDLNSKNGVLVEALGNEGATRIGAQTPVDLEPYGYEFLLSPLLRVRVRPANTREAARPRPSRALGSVLGNPTFAAAPSSIAPPPTLPPLPWSGPSGNGGTHVGQTLAVQGARRGRGAYAEPAGQRTPASASPAVQPYASVFIEPPSSPLELPPLPRAAYAAPALGVEPAKATRVSQPAAPRAVTVLEPGAAVPVLPPLAHTAWQGQGTLATAANDPSAVVPEQYTPSLEALALRGLRELAASLLPGQPVESAGDVVQLVTKLHDALEMFCRCFIPVREACSRFATPEELERASMARCRDRSEVYLGVERALEPATVAAALLDWRNPAMDAPMAVEHILADLMLQQLGTLHAALDGTRALLDELSPGRLDAGVPRSPSVLSRLGLAGGRERLLWEAFEQRHAALAAGSNFRELFGEAFGRAYQAARNGSGNPPP
jgi:predicted component of type VI protein secretion system